MIMKPFVRHIRSLSVIAGALVCAGLTGACIYEYPDEDCVDGTEIVFDWTALDHDTEAPGMAVHLYPGDGGDYYSFNLPSSGGYVSVPEGIYNAAAYNYDSESVFVIGDGAYATLAFTTRPTVITTSVPAPPKSREELEGQPVMSQPDNLWTATAADTRLLWGGRLTLAPRNVVARYTVNVTDITNGGSIARAQMSLSGLAGEYFAASGVHADETPVIVPGMLSANGDTALTGTLRTFGKAPGASSNCLQLYVWLTDGQKKVFVWQVGDQIDTAPDPMNVTINVGGFTLPDTGSKPPTGGGMEVDVDNWVVVDIELST